MHFRLEESEMKGSVLVSNNRPLMVLRLSGTISLLGWSITTCIHERVEPEGKKQRGKEKLRRFDMERKGPVLSSSCWIFKGIGDG